MKTILSVIFLLVSLTIPGLAATSAADYQVYLPLAMNVYGENACLVPALLEPADGSSLSTIAPVFRWDRGTNSLATSLTIEVSTDPTFTSGIGRYTTTSAHWVDEFRFPNNLIEGSTYHWRAYVVCGSGDLVYSAAQSFTTPTNIPRLPAPTLAAPADQSTLPGITTTLEWQSMNGASDYLVKMAKSGDNQHPFQVCTCHTVAIQSWRLKQCNGI